MKFGFAEMIPMALVVTIEPMHNSAIVSATDLWKVYNASSTFHTLEFCFFSQNRLYGIIFCLRMDVV